MHRVQALWPSVNFLTQIKLFTVASQHVSIYGEL